MRYLWIILLFIPGLVLAQDKYPYELPEYTTVANDSTDVLYIDDSGIDKHIKMPTLLGAINDTADQLRIEIDSAKVNIRGEMGGVSAFTKSGSQVSLTNSADTLNLGGDYDEKLSVNGGGHFNNGDITVTGNGTTGGNVNAYIINLNQGGGSGKISSDGDDLYLGDNTNGWRKLSDLYNLGYLFRLTNTLYTIPSTYNFHLGGSTETTYKLMVTGSMGLSSDLQFTTANKSVKFNNTGFIRESLDASSTLDFGSTSGYLTLDVNNSTDMELFNPGGYGFGVGINQTYLRAIDPSSHYGYLIFNGDSIHIYNPNAGLDYWIGTTLFGGGGSGEGVVDTVGGQSAGHLALWTDNHTLGNGPTYSGGTLNAPVLRSTSGSDPTDYIDLNAWTFQIVNNSESFVYFNPLQSFSGSEYAYDFNTANSATGNSIIARFRNHDVTKFYIKNDSTVVNNCLVVKDSAYFKGYTPVTRYAYPYIDSLNGNVMKLDSTILGAGYGLKMKLLNFRKMLRNQVNGEIAWPMSNGKFTYRPDTLLMNERENTQTAMIEQLIRKNVQLENIIYCLIGLFVLFFVIIYKKK